MFKILLATDGSSGATKAVEHVAKLCEGRSDAEVTVLFVKEPAALWGLFRPDPKNLPIPDIRGLEEAIERASQEALASARSVLEKAGRPVLVRAEVGRAHEVICSVAETENFDQVVMGKRGLGAIAGLLLGSVSDRVVHICKVPVTIVHE